MQFQAAISQANLENRARAKRRTPPTAISAVTCASDFFMRRAILFSLVRLLGRRRRARWGCHQLQKTQAGTRLDPKHSKSEIKLRLSKKRKSPQDLQVPSLVHSLSAWRRQLDPLDPESDKSVGVMCTTFLIKCSTLQ